MKKAFMKRSMVRTPLLLLMAGLVVMSCKKKKDETVTTDDAADAIAYSMESGGGGYADQTKDCSADLYTDVAYFNCSQTMDTTIVKNYSGTITATYTFIRQYALICSASGISATCTGTYNGNFDGPRMSSTNSGTRNWTITGIEPTSSVYTYAGSFTRTGTHTSKIRNQRVFNTTITVNTTNLQVDKSTYEIIGGTGTVSATCSVNGGGTYDFTGTLTYNAGGTATLILNGTTYTITLY